MSGERFTNARVHEWLTPTLDRITESMYTTRIQLNSAALWWFCKKLTAEQRAEILGEYVKVQALGGVEAGEIPPPDEAARRRRRKNSAEA